MKVIHKYKLNFTFLPSRTAVSIPCDAKILSVGSQYGLLTVWAEVDPDAPKVNHVFQVVGTGHTIPEEMGIDLEFIGTVIMFDDDLVAHVYLYN